LACACRAQPGQRHAGRLRLVRCSRKQPVRLSWQGGGACTAAAGGAAATAGDLRRADGRLRGCWRSAACRPAHSSSGVAALASGWALAHWAGCCLMCGSLSSLRLLLTCFGSCAVCGPPCATHAARPMQKRRASQVGVPACAGAVPGLPGCAACAQPHGAHRWPPCPGPCSLADNGACPRPLWPASG